MDSDTTARQWTSLSLEETGGVAGLRRGVTVTPGSLDEKVLAEVGRLAAVLVDRPARRGTGQPVPDQQTLTLRLESASGIREVTFDTADLPEALVDLRRRLPRFKPIPF